MLAASGEAWRSIAGEVVVSTLGCWLLWVATRLEVEGIVVEGEDGVTATSVGLWGSYRGALTSWVEHSL